MAKQAKQHLSKDGDQVTPAKGHAYPIAHAHALAADHIASLLQANLSSGLSNADAKQRLETYGSNSYK